MKHKKYGKRLIAMFLALMMVLSTPSVALADEAGTSAVSAVNAETVENEVDEPEAEVNAEAETEAEEDLDAKAESAADAADEKEVLSTETQDTDTEKVSEDADTEEGTVDVDTSRESAKNPDADVTAESVEESNIDVVLINEKTDADAKNAVETENDEIPGGEEINVNTAIEAAVVNSKSEELQTSEAITVSDDKTVLLEELEKDENIVLDQLANTRRIQTRASSIKVEPYNNYPTQAVGDGTASASRSVTEATTISLAILPEKGNQYYSYFPDIYYYLTPKVSDDNDILLEDQISIFASKVTAAGDYYGLDCAQIDIPTNGLNTGTATVTVKFVYYFAELGTWYQCDYTFKITQTIDTSEPTIPTSWDKEHELYVPVGYSGEMQFYVDDDDEFQTLNNMKVISADSGVAEITGQFLAGNTVADISIKGVSVGDTSVYVTYNYTGGTLTERIQVHVYEPYAMEIEKGGTDDFIHPITFDGFPVDAKGIVFDTEPTVISGDAYITISPYGSKWNTMVNADGTNTGAVAVSIAGTEAGNAVIKSAFGFRETKSSAGGSWESLHMFVDVINVTVTDSSDDQDKQIGSFSKELVRVSDSLPENVADAIENVVYPSEQEKVVIPENGTVKLLYKLKVSGEAGAAFTITDEDAVLVGNYGSNIKQNVDGTIVGTIPDGQTSIDIYVTKEFTSADITNGKLSNIANIAAGANTTLKGPASSSADVPAEEEETEPAISGDIVKNILKNVVKINCTNEKANHAGKLYDLIDDSYTIGTVKKDAESEKYTVDITVNSDKYVSQYNTDMSKEHTLSPEDQSAGTVVLIYDKAASSWKVKEDGQIPVVFTVICEDDSIQTSDCTLIKVFEGINAEQIPKNFSIDASVTNDAGYSWSSVLNKENAEVSSDGMTYTWTIKTAYYSGSYNKKYTNHVTLTEHNYAVSGYQNTIFYDSNGQYEKINGDTINFLIGHSFIGGERRIKNEYTATSSPTYTVTYTDGVSDEKVFPDEVYSGLLSGTLTPKFQGTLDREGYIFKGWSPEVADTVTKDVIYTALWEKKDTIQYPVQLVIYHNGNTETPYKTVHLANLAKGETYDLTSLKIEDHYSEKNREDYEFEGWYNDGGWNSYKAGSKGNTLGNTITINGWTNIICMVTDYEKVVVKAVTNGDKENAQTIFNGTALRGTNLLEYLEDHVKDLDKEGYTLDKWFNWDWYGHKFGTETKVNGWTNVYVTYTINKYPVTLYIYKDGDTSKSVQTVEIGSFDYQTVLKNIASELNAEDYYTEQNKFAIGYEIEDAWYAVEPDDSMGAELADTDVVSVDGSSIACMVYDQYPVYYTIDGVRDSAYDVITAKTWQGYTLRVPEAKEGYEFDGWYQDKKDIGTDDKKIDRLKQLKKYELYGVYSPCKYTVTFDPGLGTCDQKTKVVRFHSKYGNLPSAVREGYTFMGWTLNGDLITDKSVVKIPRDHTLTASYEANTYTIIYHGNGGYLTSNPEKDQTTSNWKYDQEVTLKNADTFTKENWAFLGWSTAPDGKAEYAGSQKGVFNFTAEPNGEIHLYAVWTPYQTPLDPIKAAYRVEHYKEQLDGTYKLAEAEFPVYVDVKDENGTLVEATAKAYDHYTENLTHSDRVASGIVKKPVWVDDNIEWEMVTLKLYYDLDEYEVVFEAGANGTFQNGETKVSGNHKYGALYPEAPVVTAQKGYVFAGWFTEGKKAEDFPETVTADAVYTAQYKEDKNNNGIADDEEEKYTVTYTDGVAKEEIFKDQVTGNLLSGTATPVFQGTPSRSGYVFGGWNPAVAATVTGNAVYTAVWKEDRNNNGIADDTETKYSVTYNDGVDDEEIFKDQVYTDLLSGTATPGFVGTPDRDGYTFKGWSPEISEKVNGTVTYRATWDKNSSGKKKHHHSGSSEDTNTGSAAAPAANSQPAATASPQTGDSNPIIPMFALAIASLLGITLVLAGRKKKDAKA